METFGDESNHAVNICGLGNVGSERSEGRIPPRSQNPSGLYIRNEKEMNLHAITMIPEITYPELEA